ncbi:uncharacterized protein LOC129740717 [Uranotaenia lowii]|uniref:uncharacterized protein LOC129740717 n=1 Tax=Uranotaenia lowii TaxID=190385 RepID=UPI0024785ADF|nr:uncharacterized protein LOC129740717 [Uranotaenia lowii]
MYSLVKSVLIACSIYFVILQLSRGIDGADQKYSMGLNSPSTRKPSGQNPSTTIKSLGSDKCARAPSVVCSSQAYAKQCNFEQRCIDSKLGYAALNQNKPN